MGVHRLTETLTYSVKEAAKVLGIGTALTYELVKQEKIPILRLGKTIRIPKKALHELINK